MATKKFHNSSYATNIVSYAGICLRQRNPLLKLLELLQL